MEFDVKSLGLKKPKGLDKERKGGVKTISLWSGGKDSCFACYKAISRGYKIAALFNFTNSDGKNSLSHGLEAKLILKQAAMTDIALVQKAMPKERYREEFKSLIFTWKKKEGIKGIVFGDIYLQEHKDWIDKVCEELQVEAIMPLWGRDTKELIEEFVQAGFKALVVSVKQDCLSKEWLGKNVDEEFIKEINALGNVDLCGEKGEFHTFVYDGPIFKKPVAFGIGQKFLKDKYWFLNIEERVD